jgi:hypothetical protein
MRLLSSHNQCPNFLSLALELIPLQSKEEFDLCLSLNLNQDTATILDGSLRFGIRQAKLELELENCLISTLETRPFDSYDNTTEVSDINPTWILAVQQDRVQPILKGNWTDKKLGKIRATGKPAKITAILTINPTDIYTSEIEGLWRHDISPNKHGILERKLALFLFENYFNPYVSRLELTTAEINTPTVKTDKPLVAKVGPKEIASLIKSVYQSETDNFLALAKIANLNPLIDFAGGNLVGSNLSGINLSGANLHHTNLRGADLTDADLSEANLSYAKLSGADLSGAYLQSANLRHSDFHRASLALANLISVDLSNANLLETNLSNANYRSAKVAGTIFGNNPGLSEEGKQDLIQKGAIFV